MWVINSDVFLLVLRKCESYKFLRTVIYVHVLYVRLHMSTYYTTSQTAQTARTVFSDVPFPTYRYSFP